MIFDLFIIYNKNKKNKNLSLIKIFWGILIVKLLLENLKSSSLQFSSFLNIRYNVNIDSSFLNIVSL